MRLHGDAKVILTVEDDQVRLALTTDDFLDDRKAEAAADLGKVVPDDGDRGGRG